MTGFGLIVRFRLDVLFIFALFQRMAIVRGSSPSSAPGPYTSVAALDKFGNSVQLRNAKLASSLHGSLVVACVAPLDHAIVVCRVDRSFPGRKDTDSSVIQIIGLQEDVLESERRNIVALVCSGITADAVLLRSLLREQARRIWERYGVTTPVNRLCDSLSEVLLSFMQYDRSRELNDGTGPVIVDKDFRMARPFGVDTLVLGVDGPIFKEENHKYNKNPILIHVDAAGVQHVLTAKALGKRSATAEKILKDLYTNNMTVQQAKDACIKAIRKVILEAEAASDISSNTHSIRCDILDASGVNSNVENLIIV